MEPSTANSLQKRVERIITDTESLHAKVMELTKEYNEERTKVLQPYEEKVKKAKNEKTKTTRKYYEIERKLEVLSRIPSLNNATALVNKTLKNKTNNQKLELLGNLAGKSTLLSKKKNRIAKGRQALIQKQFNLSKMNYNTVTRKELAKLQTERSQLKTTLNQQTTALKNMNAQNPLLALDNSYGEKYQKLSLELKPLVALWNEALSSKEKLTNDTIRPKIPKAAELLNQSMQLLLPHYPETPLPTLLIPAQPRPQPPPQRAYVQPTPVYEEPVQFNARAAAREYIGMLQNLNEFNVYSPADYAEEMGLTRSQLREMMYYLNSGRGRRRGRRGENFLQGNPGY